jgi:hypothetical protein
MLIITAAAVAIVGTTKVVLLAYEVLCSIIEGFALSTC